MPIQLLQIYHCHGAHMPTTLKRNQTTYMEKGYYNNDDESVRGNLGNLTECGAIDDTRFGCRGGNQNVEGDSLTFG